MYGMYIGRELVFSNNVKDIVDYKARNFCFSVFQGFKKDIMVFDEGNTIRYIIVGKDYIPTTVEVRLIECMDDMH